MDIRLFVLYLKDFKVKYYDPPVSDTIIEFCI